MTPSGEEAARVLVVEDDANTREALSLVLGGAGFAVDAAANGREALDLLRGGLRPRLILLDLMMPVMDGWAFRAEQLRDPALADIPVVVCSAAHELPQRAASLQAAAVFPKPVSFDRLAEAVRPHVGPQRAGVLVVDDEPQVRRLLELLLAREGLTVWSAGAGQAAVELFKQHHAAIAAVLLDVQMPGLDGPWTLAALRQVDPQVRAVFFSGGTGDYDAELLLAMGAARVLQKPLDLGQVGLAIRGLLAGQGPPDDPG